MLRLTLIVLLFALPSVGCSLIHDTPATKGASYTKETWREEVNSQPLGEGKTPTPIPSKPLVREHTLETFNQGENPSSRSSFEKAPDGTISMLLGTGRANESIVPPPPDFTKYIGLVVSLLFLAGGIYISTNPVLKLTSPGLGSRLILAGVLGAVVSMTIDSYGALYAGGILLVGLYLAYSHHSAYQKGLLTPVPDAS
jgi:hypothetical protein